MMRTRFPIWYPFQEIESIKFKTKKEEIESLLRGRLLVYNDGDFNYDQRPDESHKEYHDRMTEERKSYTLLKMGMTNEDKEKGYLSSWFIEKEGDLFEKRFSDSNWEIKEKILRHLFPNDDFGQNWYPLDQLSNILDEKLEKILGIGNEDHMLRKISNQRGGRRIDVRKGLHKVICINFRYADYMVRSRKSTLYKGWIIDNVDRLTSTIKKRYEDALFEDLENYKEKINSEAPGPIRRLTEYISNVLTNMIPRNAEFDFSNFKFEGSYDENLLLFPPCIQDLMGQMKTAGYLKHHNRFQLGLFLKHTGMGVDDQMNYWFNFAVDNLDISYDQFEKNVGYTIRHLYGMEGGKTDYDMMSCGTIQSTANYHCRFQDLKIEKIKEIIQEYIFSLPADQQMEKANIFKNKLEPLIKVGKPSEACAKNLSLTIPKDYVWERISHPLQYLKLSIDNGETKTKNEENINGVKND